MRRMKLSLLLAMVVLVLVPLLAGKPQQGSRTEKGILDVQVFDAEDGSRISGATVAVPGYRSTTGLGGSCRFSLVPGRYSVLIRKQGYRGRRINAGVKPGETTTLRVELKKLPGRSSRN